ncbi:TraR/DksA family transcriptional regulator [Sediminitomix flava]|uniref:TraR/DksA family transcriptional regulator n=1 Tax=Sediminitomix flava TaxID=379075 RepID=A0A315ZGN3_SEDFL|nr:TraR/DksA C4-type zinc finger protein [Sediminitomix flava]PWJ44290.1 TraR/DksA family transcriptional regulator [Sediminitomix flava]
MATEQLRYSPSELKEFEELLEKKINSSKSELEHLKNSILKSQSGHDGNHNGAKTLEDGAAAFEKEQLNQLAARTRKYIEQLERAMVRIKNGTYGICVDTGKLISKDRLRAVPHTLHSIEAKMNKA